jgi:predicted membrane protein
MTTQARPNVTPQFVLGICIMLFGVLLLLERLGILIQGLRLWPVALMGLGIWVWAEPRHRRSRGWGMVLILVGTWMLLSNFGVIAVGFWRIVWPLLIIWLGLTLIRQTLWRGRRLSPPGWNPPGGPSDGPIVDGPMPDTAIPDMPTPDMTMPDMSIPGTPIPDVSIPHMSGDAGGQRPGNAASAPSQPYAKFFSNFEEWEGPGRISIFAALAASKRSSSDSPFRGGDMTAFMGGCQLDLRLASIPRGGEAVIDVFAVMGGLEVWVPQGWAVVSQVFPFMGGVDDKRLPPLEPLSSPDTRPKLVLRGMVLMGGLVIKN